MRSIGRVVTVVTLTAGGLAACSADTTSPFAPFGLELALTPSVDTIFVADTTARGVGTYTGEFCLGDGDEPDVT